jgi:hypothetical protein
VDELGATLSVLAALPEEQWVVDVEGYSVADTARLLGIVKSRCAGDGSSWPKLGYRPGR